MEKWVKVFAKYVILLLCFLVLFTGCQAQTEPENGESSFTVTFNSNDGSSNPEVFTLVLTENSLQPLVSISELGFSKTGYQFVGWATELDTMRAEYTDCQFFRPTKNITLYAIWQKKQYSVILNLDNGSEPIILKQDYGSVITPPGVPIKVGYTFSSWDKTIPQTMPAENIMVNALWKVNQYTITFNLDNGTEPISITQNFGTDIIVPSNITKTGYTFSGWDKTMPETMPAKNITLTAQWSISYFYLTFDFDNGTEPVTFLQNYGSIIIPPEAPEKTGYTFSRWNKPVPVKMPAENITITALWRPPLSCNIDFYSGGDVRISSEGLTFTATPELSGIYTYEWYFNGQKQNSTINTCTIDPENVLPGYYELIVCAIDEKNIINTSSCQITIQQEN